MSSEETQQVINHLLDHPELDWDWEYLTAFIYTLIPFLYFTQHKDKSWDISVLTKNPLLQVEDLYGNQDVAWDYKYLTTFFSFDQILTHTDLPWDWDYLSINTPFSQIIQHPELPWVYKKLSKKISA